MTSHLKQSLLFVNDAAEALCKLDDPHNERDLVDQHDALHRLIEQTKEMLLNAVDLVNSDYRDLKAGINDMDADSESYSELLSLIDQLPGESEYEPIGTFESGVRTNGR